MVSQSTTGPGLRIAVLGTRGLPPRYGGRETATDEIGRRLVERGHRVVVYCRESNSAPPRPARFSGIELIHLPSPGTKGLDSMTHLWASALHAVARRPADVWVLSDIGTAAVIPLARAFGRRVLWWVDGPAWGRAKWGPGARLYFRLADRLGIALAHEMVVDSRVAQELYARRTKRPSVYIPYGATAPEPRGRQTLDELGLEREGYVLFVGRLTPEKGVHHLIRAFEGVRSPQRLVIVGDNPYDRDYVRGLRSTSDARIVFAGYRFDDEFAQLMRHCRIYVQPSEVEGTSPVLLSAMGYGRPVVVQGIAENLETVGEAGRAFAPGDVEGLRAILQELLEDEPARLALGAAATERVAEFYDWERITDAFEVACRRAAGRAQPTPSSSRR